MAEYEDLLDYNEDLGNSDDEKDSKESLFKSRRIVSNDKAGDCVGDNSQRSRSPIRVPSFDSRESTASNESAPEPIENVPALKTR